MTTSSLAPRARLADHALATFLAPLLAGRRVAVVGSSSGDVAHRVRALGAQTVLCFGGVAEDMAVRALTPGAIAAFHGRIDVVLVPDAGAVPSLVAVLDEARRALGSGGLVAVGSDSEGGHAMEPRTQGAAVPYRDLVELCAARFAEVRVLGRGPFVGYALAALDEEPDGIALDTRLMEGDAPRPEAFVALASDTAIAVDPLAVVQVPDHVLGALREDAGRELREQIAERDRKLKEVEAASAERWVKVQRYEHGIKELEDENRKARDRGVRLQKELDDERKLRQRIELDAQMNRRAPELPRTPDPDVEKLRAELAASEQALRAAKAELEAERGRAKEHAGVAAEARRSSEAAGAAGAELRAEVEALRAEVVGARRSRAEVEAALSAARDEATSLRKAHAETVAAVLTLQQEVVGLRRELDETQAMEAELQSQLAEAGAESAAPAADPAALLASQRELDAAITALTDERAAREAEHGRLEALLAERTREVMGLQSAVRRGEEAVRELGFALRRALPAEVEETSTGREAATPAVATVETSEAQRTALDDRLARWEADAIAHAAEAQRLRWRNDELAARLAAAERALPTEVAVMVDDAVGDALRLQLQDLAAREARLDGALRGMAARVREGEGTAADLERSLVEARGSAEQHRLAAHEARGEVSRLYALNLGLEARLLHRTMELEGARAGFERRVAELQQEEERLLRALEVVGTQAAMESREALGARQREVMALRAELEGMDFRLRECEAAVVESGRADVTAVLMRERDALQVSLAAVRGERDALSGRLAEANEALARAASGRDPLEMEPGEGQREGQVRVDQVLADLSATAGKLAETEEALSANRAERERLAGSVAELESELRGARTDIELLRVELEATRSEADRARTEVDGVRADAGAVRSAADQAKAEAEAARAELSRREAEVQSRSRELDAMAERLGERDRTIATLERKLSSESESLARASAELSSRPVEGRSKEQLAALGSAKEAIRSMLIEGRGALVAFELTQILRTLESAG